ncbi:MAG: ADP-forming succinate--CoA ligase subunit beta [Candidatus Aminicenantes bacterium]|jgi:succinyl-CoA synthetase beta subunit|nr:ADP-forming succinate--CoA ligase subunit beta [Candidatus Aminicenantes bacterium]
MLIHEYQAKDFLKKLGIKIPGGSVACNQDEAIKIIEVLGLPVVLKGQILSGGRGKAGAIVLANSLEEAIKSAKNLFGKKITTSQLGNRTFIVKKILVEKALNIKKEFYLGFTLDRKKETLTAMVSSAGGMEIEEVARIHPELLKKECFYPESGLLPFQVRNLAYFLEVPDVVFATLADYLIKLSEFFLKYDLRLLEINPLVLTEKNELVAVDAKMDFDDSGLSRHPEIASLEDITELSPEEIEARRYQLNYLKMNGSIGCLVNGAGLAMATMDIIKYFGGQPANFLDIGGGVTEEAVSKAFEILIKDDQVHSALVNIFGGIVRCDLVARGVVASARKISLQKPVVVRMEGTNVAEGKKILQESGYPLHFVDNFEEAAKMAVFLSQAKGKG